jgi:hypothetical protein
MKRALYVLAAILSLGGGIVFLLANGHLGNHEGPGTVNPTPLPAPTLDERATAAVLAARGVGAPAQQILFGDLHVHTTFSSDAFVMSLPLVSGEGSHPPADACDFARHCAALDFWSINDHAESLTPTHWRETVDSIRQCNAVSDPADPDVTAFLGWEWTQDGRTPDDHWGHKNVVLRSVAEGEVPSRPIGALQPDGDIVVLSPLVRAGLALFLQDRRTLDFTRFLAETAAIPLCPDGVRVQDLPDSCKEATQTPGELFRKLDEWAVDSLVIPHGTTWGNTAPPAASWDRQISRENSDSKRQTLFEIYSGHGNSEEFRDFTAVAHLAGGDRTCPPPQPGPSGFLANCWRAGEIIRERCLDSGEDNETCERRAQLARQNHIEGGRAGFRTVLGASVEDWQDAGQCRDCFLPAFDYRPRMSAQYILVRRDFEGASPQGTRFGFIGSSDNHTARPGTGYKEQNRSEMTESKGPRAGAPDILGNQNDARAHSVSLDEQPSLPFADRDIERMSSFLTTGGLVGLHAEGRDRDSIWRAIQSRQVYGTSGDRILLWFDLMNSPEGAGHEVPMGSEIEMGESPRFRARAVGAWHQQPGCPEPARRALGEQRLYDLCRDECYFPADVRKRITRVEVVRLRPQQYDAEPIAELIEDPWLTLPCPADGSGCVVEFEDPDFPLSGRGAAYYVRAVQEPTPAVNGANLRCERDEAGECITLRPCHGDDAKTAYQDDCTEMTEERAWSSPIWVDPVPAPSALATAR